MDEQGAKRPLPRFPKRPRSPTNRSSLEKRLRLSSSNVSICDGTRRIVLDTRRCENRQLLQNRNDLEKEKKVFTERLIPNHGGITTLRNDMTSMGHKKEKDAQRRELEQKLHEIRTWGEEIRNTTLDSNQTIVKMDKLLQSCEHWRENFTLWSGKLGKRVEDYEAQEVKSLVEDLVTRVERGVLQDELKTKHVELQWAIWLQDDVAKCLKELHKDRQETELFEAMEKQLMNDRVVELETQLAQKRAVEKEKERELSLLRADQEQLMQSSRTALMEEVDTYIAEKKAIDAELKQLKEKVKQQTQELVRVDKERATLRLQNQKLEEEVQHLREKHETRELEILQQSVKLEKKIKEVHALLQTAKSREAKAVAALETADKVVEKSRQRKEELKILYAKFSSAMDSVSEKTMRLEELEHELKDCQSIQTQNEQLRQQVAQLQLEKAEMLAARYDRRDDMNKELISVQRQLKESKELASQHGNLVSKMQLEITKLEAQNEALRKQQVKQRHPPDEGEKQSSNTDDKLVLEVAEKEALQMFVRRYYSAAEEKCTRLLKKVSELELQNTRTQEQAKESCSLVHVCAKMETCDECMRSRV